MNLKININYTTNYSHKYNQPAFNGLSRKMLRNTGYALTAATILSFASCSNNNNNTKQDTDSFQTEVKDSLNEKIDSTDNKPKVENIYHYFPKDNNIITDVPDWSEKIFPDGSREIDSLEYNIKISPEGKRTVTKTETDETGNTTITTEFPDSTKTVKIIYKTLKPKEILEVEKTYWSNGKLKENKLFNEYLSDSTNLSSPTIIKQRYERFNEDEVLLYWETNGTDVEVNDSNSIYDDDKRIIYNNIKNEKYYYKGTHKTPYTSVSEFENCKRTILYNDSGLVEKTIFEAADGTITEK